MQPIIRGFLLSIIFGFTFLSAYGENLNSFEAKFIQTTYQDKEKIIYQGNLVAKRPHMAKWTYTLPLKKEIYLNANAVLIYEPALFQATISRLDQNIDLFSIIKQAKLESSNKDITIYSAQIGDTLYYLEVKDTLPYRIIYNDPLDNRVEIVFSAQKINKEISDSIFIFHPPEGIDFIEQ